MNWKQLLIFGSSLLLISFSVLQFNYAEVPEEDPFDQAKERIVLREIGHKILLHAGDSTSRIMPIKETNNKTYHIRFESPFSFKPDSIVDIIHTIIKSHRLSQDYIVKVLDCMNEEVIYGYAILKSTQNDIVPCSNRIQEKNCYFITLQFPASSPNDGRKGYFAWSLFFAGIGLFLLALWRLFSSRMIKEEGENYKNSILCIGAISFNFEEQFIEIGTEKIGLTPTESNLFYLFAKSPNRVISKAQILKEIWNNNGELKSRSLDVFISRLRKKLQTAEGIELVNVHGKGYKLEVPSV